MLEQYEKVEINITAPASSTLQSTEAGDIVNSEFRLEIKPDTGAITPVSRHYTCPDRHCYELETSFNELNWFFSL